MKKGDIYMADMGKDEGSLQSGLRPVIIVSNDAANKYSPVVTVIPMTSQRKKRLPTHVYIQNCGLVKPSLALAEQITCINKSKIMQKKVGSIQDTVYEEKLKAAIQVQLSI